MGDIWVVVESRGKDITTVTYEMLGDASKLVATTKGKVKAVILGESIPEGIIEAMPCYGADCVYCLEHPLLGDYSTETFVLAMEQLLKNEEPSIVLLGATSMGQELAPRLATRLGAGVITNCVILKFKGEVLECLVQSFGGKVYQTRQHLTPWRVVTMVPGVAGVGEPKKGRQSEVRRLVPNIKQEDIRTRVVAFISADPRTLEITEAEKIVAAGYGVGNKEGFIMVEELADLLGAALAGSRVAVDLGWMPYERQVGQSGKTVAPKLYLAVGISGASPHSIGMRDSEVIIAINNDRNANIMKLANMAVLGDLHQVVPSLIRKLREK